MPYVRFRKTGSGVTGVKRDGSTVHFNTQSVAEARRRAAIRESYSKAKRGKR